MDLIVGLSPVWRSRDSAASFTPLTAHYRHLTIEDRIKIQTLHERAESKAKITRRIGVIKRLTNGWMPQEISGRLDLELRPRAVRGVHLERIKWRASIHDHAAEVSDRSQFGQWESDRFLGAHSTAALHTTVERVSQYLCAQKLPGAPAHATLDAQLAVYARFPANVVASVTADSRALTSTSMVVFANICPNE